MTKRRKVYRVEWVWLNGEAGSTVPFTRKREAEQAMNRYRKVALIDPGTCQLVTEFRGSGGQAL